MNNDESTYSLAEEFVQLTDCPIFITGKAGTGKTTFLKKIRESTHKQIAVVAPTGVAAINAGGTTLHSFFQLPFTPFVPTIEGKKNLISKSKLTRIRRKVLQELELLVIDEISMVRADLLDAVDTMLRHFRYRPNEPFGGVQMIFIGDMYQLSPVVRDEEWQLLSQFYDGPYFFQSKAIQSQPPVYIELDHIFRQSNSNFIKLLNEVRNNKLSAESRALLNSRYIPDFYPAKKDGYITLTTHNAKADKINNNELEKIKNESFKFLAKVDGEFPEKSYPNEYELTLKKGAHVMFIANDKANPRRYYNGKLGEISEIDDEKITVTCDDEENIEVVRETWENIRYEIDKKNNNIEETTLGAYTQYPLRLAWAITIHKSQGLTFDKVVIDAGAAFASGQVYVALSRCRTLEGLVLTTPINENTLAVDTEILRYAQQKKSADELEIQIKKFKEIYSKKILLTIFDFSAIVGEIKDLLDSTKEVESSFNAETIPFLNTILLQVIEISNVANRFQTQMQQLFAQNDDAKLKERIAAAADYFCKKIKETNAQIEQSPATSDNRQNAYEYSDRLTSIYSHLECKNVVINGIRNDFSVSNYFDIKSNFTNPTIRISAYAAEKVQVAKDIENPELYKYLAQARNEICEDSGIPVFLIATGKTIADMSKYLPQSIEEIEQIKGFGVVKARKYGDIFLDIINDYCAKNNLKSQIDKIGGKVKKAKKPKKEKVDTKLITFTMHCQGKNVEEIAHERGLTTATIEGHLAYYIAKGDIDISDFFPQDIIDESYDIIKENKDSRPIYEHFKGKISYGQIRMLRAAIMKNS